jgi:hypothetical protein
MGANASAPAKSWAVVETRVRSIEAFRANLEREVWLFCAPRQSVNE